MLLLHGRWIRIKLVRDFVRVFFSGLKVFMVKLLEIELGVVKVITSDPCMKRFFRHRTRLVWCRDFEIKSLAINVNGITTKQACLEWVTPSCSSTPRMGGSVLYINIYIYSALLSVLLLHDVGCLPDRT